jgi:hypothetical protein
MFPLSQLKSEFQIKLLSLTQTFVLNACSTPLSRSSPAPRLSSLLKTATSLGITFGISISGLPPDWRHWASLNLPRSRKLSVPRFFGKFPTRCHLISAFPVHCFH